MPPSTSRDVILPVALLGVAVVLSVLTIAATPASEVPGTGSTFSAGPRGTKAAYLMLSRLGYSTRRSFEPLADLPLDGSVGAVIVASPVLPVSAGDRARVKQFIEEGGTVLATGAGASLLPSLAFLDLRTVEDEFVPRKTESVEAARGHGVAGADSILLAREASVGPVPSPYIVRYGSAPEAAVVEARIGKGRAVWFAGSDPMLNASATRVGHAELLLEILGEPGDRPVIWAEYYHGHGRSFWSYVSGTPALAILIQVAALGLVAFTTFGPRHGPLRPDPVPQRTSALEFVDALAALYRKAGAASGAVDIARQRTRRVLASLSGLDGTATNERLAQAAAVRLGIPAASVSETLRRADLASDIAAVRPPEALHIVGKLQAIATAAHDAMSARGARLP
jgi:hypothetical protein